MRNFVMTSEAVTAGHPDKLCDRISDAVVDAYLTGAGRCRVVAECAIATGVVFLSVRSDVDAPTDLASLARRVMADVGYGPEAQSDRTTVVLDTGPPQRTDGDLAPDRAQQMTTVFGYACEGTPELMPVPVWIAHRLTRALDAARAEERLPWLSPDAQAQVAVRFEERRAVRLEAVALGFGTVARPGGALADSLTAEAIAPALEGSPVPFDAQTRLILVPGAEPQGPAAHSGLTGRKTADDAYGAFSRRGGSALSGKDPSRIDRTAAYAARHAARAAVEAGLARELEVQLSYLVGEAGPTSVEVDSFDSGRLPDATIAARIAERIDLRVGRLAERLDLWERPAARGGRFYQELTAYGHMGRSDLAAPWEDVAEAAARLAAP